MKQSLLALFFAFFILTIFFSISAGSVVGASFNSTNYHMFNSSLKNVDAVRVDPSGDLIASYLSINSNYNHSLVAYDVDIDQSDMTISQ
ncbi:MAG: hypothetical protein ACQESC_04895, partial [Nanobdellota archaeon]